MNANECHNPNTPDWKVLVKLVRLVRLVRLLRLVSLVRLLGLVGLLGLPRQKSVYANVFVEINPVMKE